MNDPRSHPKNNSQTGWHTFGELFHRLGNGLRRLWWPNMGNFQILWAIHQRLPHAIFFRLLSKFSHYTLWKYREPLVTSLSWSYALIHRLIDCNMLTCTFNTDVQHKPLLCALRVAPYWDVLGWLTRGFYPGYDGSDEDLTSGGGCLWMFGAILGLPTLGWMGKRWSSRGNSDQRIQGSSDSCTSLQMAVLNIGRVLKRFPMQRPPVRGHPCDVGVTLVDATKPAE